MKPMFTPKDGVGTKYIDPENGQTYVYTSKGWQLSSNNIQQETSQSNTFEVKPDEKNLESTLLKNGSNISDVQQALTERRRIKSNNQNQNKLNNQGSSNNNILTQKNTSSPFGNMTKEQVLRDAFNKGVHSTSELKMLGETYDLLVPETEQVLDQNIDFSNLTPEEMNMAKQDLASLVATKAQSLPAVTERDTVFGALATFETGQEIIDMLENKEVNTGMFSGGLRKGISVFGTQIIPGSRNFGWTSEQEDYYASLSTLFTANFMKAISGATISDAERRYLMNALPDESKSEQANIQGVKAISDYLATKASNLVNINLDALKPTQMNQDPLNIKVNQNNMEDNPLGI